MTNAELARNLDLLADLSELDGANSFSVRAYHNAAATVRALEEQVSALLASGFELTQIKGIGKEIAAKLKTLVDTGALPQIAALQERVPLGLLEVVQVKGVGAKQARTLYDTLGVASLDDLEAAAKDGKIAALSGFGAKTQERILKGIDSLRRNSGRMRLSEVDAVLTPLLAGLRAVPGVERLEVAGSYRRRRETVGDIDLLVVATDGRAVSDALTGWPDVRQVLGQGETKTSVELGNGLQVDMRTVDAESFGAALLYFTGSKEHGVALRQRALERGWHLNEYGLFEGGEPGKERVGGKRLGGETEAEIYGLLDMAFVPPELRENRGEVAAAAENRLPQLIELGDIRGDLHMHTTASDGTASILEMAEAAKARGREYIAITDHSKRVSMANGLDAPRLLAHWEAIEEARKSIQGIRILKGIECDILEDATLDLPDEVLAQADWVIAVLHYGLSQSREQIMKRLMCAITNPHVDVIGHPTGRLIDRRQPADIDFDQFFDACAQHGVMVEINAHPARLDLDDVQAAAAKKRGIPIVINTDAHGFADMDLMRYGVYQARRAGLTAADIANTLPLDEFLAKVQR
ncbi:MAG: DNA polymerase/3'-5' exonuclease PolX [Trueperaceae bacterium]|nr:DNA polymerase/3'-5' exonuclease PolX [Trueperaceae bacterium]